MMDADYREIGMGIIDATKGKDVGPILVSQEFGNRFHFGNSFFLGVIYSDTNHDGQYNAGEGAGGATINFTGKAGTFSTTSMSAGGYQLQIPAGTYTVSATAKALGGTVYYHNLNIGSQNAKQDFLAGNWPLAHYSKGRLTIEGTAGNDVFSVTESAGQIHVKRNKQTESFDAAKISRIDLFGANGNDTIDFSTVSIPTYIDAGKGNDSVICGGGSDTVTGGAGNDTVFGGNGNDQLHGSIGNDWLYGQAGRERFARYVAARRSSADVAATPASPPARRGVAATSLSAIPRRSSRASRRPWRRRWSIPSSEAHRPPAPIEIPRHSKGRSRRRCPGCAIQRRAR
jgi:Ca2+-binding RTX toxin-like protein